jgi:hypothetical protein
MDPLSIITIAIAILNKAVKLRDQIRDNQASLAFTIGNLFILRDSV